jgi:hypothetical protein
MNQLVASIFEVYGGLMLIIDGGFETLIVVLAELVHPFEVT